MNLLGDMLAVTGASAGGVLLASVLVSALLCVALVGCRLRLADRQAALAGSTGSADRRLRETLRIARLGSLEFRAETGLWLPDGEGRDILGLDPAEAGGPDDVLARVHREDLPKVRASLGSAAEADVDIEFRVVANGGERMVHALGSRASAGETCPIVTLQDVSARHAAEKDRAEMIERMAEANRLEALGTLAGGIAHEINNPAQYIGDNLVFIRSSVAKLLDVVTEAERVAAEDGDWRRVAAKVSTLRLDFLRKELPVAADQAIDGIERIGNIVQAIREFCYPSGKVSTLLDLNHLIEVTSQVTRNQWKYVSAMELDLDESLPMIAGVEGEIAQVMVNLIVNAAHAIAERKAPEPGRITIRTRRLDQIVELSVSDTGNGIARDAVGRIFEMFYTTKPPGQGTGQGLAISHAIVSRHGGQIQVESEPGEGTRFTIRLPIEAPPATAPNPGY